MIEVQEIGRECACGREILLPNWTYCDNRECFRKRRNAYQRIYKENRDRAEQKLPSLSKVHCKRCDILLTKGGGDDTHCEDCLNEMGII